MAVTSPDQPGLQARLAASVRDPLLIDAAQALRHGRLDIAEFLLRRRLRERANDVAAIRMLAELAGRLGRYEDAASLLRAALAIAPDFDAARANYASVLHRMSRPKEALAELDILLQRDPRDPAHLAIRAAVLTRIGEYDAAIAIYRDILERFADQPRLWVSLGHALKTVGHQAQSIAAYRRAIAEAPSFGEAWWSLSNLKTVRFDARDREAMQAALAESRAQGGAQGGAHDEADRLHLHFALGKALEDAGEHDSAFAQYDAANAIRHAQLGASGQDISRHVDASIAAFTPAVFAVRAGQGCLDPDPIFIVGLPRAGSTLIEQILSSHSQVEGTMELPDLTVLAGELAGRRHAGGPDDVGYLDALLAQPPDALAELGRRYLERTRVQRKTDRPFFVDKMPANFTHVGLIALILPRARIIDARRHPMACCFSAFKQHFSRGQGFTYDLETLGRYYRDYVRLMDHYDAILPARVHRVWHEALIADPDSRIRDLLAHCGLPFEAACLQPHRTERAVRTASSEQVRRPISAASTDQWRHYAAHLAPLRRTLGHLVDEYPFASLAAARASGTGEDDAA